ncbi:MAG: carboxymethylenebutenolidase [Frankiaceae bacterium]|jgi:carboxymethylenebutenolidase|nr:carboxymethylenebutenolidase [Frankiaceae bacterium]
MCVSDEARLPIDAAGPGAATLADLTLRAADGTSFAATLARPSEPAGSGVLVLPDNRGLRPFYEQLALRLAEHGHLTVVIDWFGRTDGVGKNRPPDWPAMDHLGQVTREGLEQDIAAGIAELRSAGARSIVAVGFCFGGRQAFFSAQPKFGLAGVVGFYGAPQALRGAPGPSDRAGELAAPILGLFGGADTGIPPETVAEFDGALAAAGVPHEFVVYPDAPHSFFDKTQELYADASADAWRRVLDFVAARTAAA